ncbi:unnamed protein product [Paramecium pentaurelia]|uniref:Uncharacterized protein n=1 Tax=Paramecium pentaurelia TaxID=43138 RepID=A0A8S1XPS2_9CILI|nr:unnamed protein product [Paramecium pentaurelia]
MQFILYIFIIQANKHRLNLDPGLMTQVFDSPVSIAMIAQSAIFLTYWLN